MSLKKKRAKLSARGMNKIVQLDLSRGRPCKEQLDLSMKMPELDKYTFNWCLKTEKRIPKRPLIRP